MDVLSNLIVVIILLYMYTTLYILNLCHVMCQLHLNKKKKMEAYKNYPSQDTF